MTLIEMLVAVAVSSVVLVGMGSLFMQAVWSYRNVNYLTTGYIGQGRLDNVMRSLLMGVPTDPTHRSLFNTTPSVNAAGVAIAPRAFAYLLPTQDLGTLVSGVPSVDPSLGDAVKYRVGVVYWYRNNALPGQAGIPDVEQTDFEESSILWIEIAQSDAATIMNPPGLDSFMSYSDAQMLTFTNTLNFRKSSTILATNVHAFILTPDPKDASNFSYRVEFQTPP